MRAFGGEILQTRIPYACETTQKLPGVSPVAPGAWLHLDEAYAAQIALKQQLLEDREEAVHQCDARAMPAAQELLTTVLDELQAQHAVTKQGAGYSMPDGRLVVPDAAEPLKSLAALVQEDFCILQKQDSEHVLTAALLCFPASWTLAEKFMKPLVRIHQPVADYDANIAARVQRLFDGVRVGRPLWRYNLLHYAQPDLFQPKSEAQPRDPAQERSYRRSERQVILRLPETKAVVFSIHTYVVRA